MPARSRYASNGSGTTYQDGGSSVQARDWGGRNLARARVRRMRAATVDRLSPRTDGEELETGGPENRSPSRHVGAMLRDGPVVFAVVLADGA